MSPVFKQFVFLIFCAVLAKVEAGMPTEAREERIQKSGSLIKGRNAPLAKFFQKAFRFEAPVKKCIKDLRREDLYYATLNILEDFLLIYVSKKEGKIETAFINVPEFDNTNTFKYKIFANISNNDVKIEIRSKADSTKNLRNFEKRLRKRILLFAQK
jgi:hypothetical protein